MASEIYLLDYAAEDPEVRSYLEYLEKFNSGIGIDFKKEKKAFAREAAAKYINSDQSLHFILQLIANEDGFADLFIDYQPNSVELQNENLLRLYNHLGPTEGDIITGAGPKHLHDIWGSIDSRAKRYVRNILKEDPKLGNRWKTETLNTEAIKKLDYIVTYLLKVNERQLADYPRKILENWETGMWERTGAPVDEYVNNLVKGGFIDDADRTKTELTELFSPEYSGGKDYKKVIENSS